MLVGVLDASETSRRELSLVDRENTGVTSETLRMKHHETGTSWPGIFTQAKARSPIDRVPPTGPGVHRSQGGSPWSDEVAKCRKALGWPTAARPRRVKSLCLMSTAFFNALCLFLLFMASCFPVIGLLWSSVDYRGLAPVSFLSPRALLLDSSSPYLFQSTALTSARVIFAAVFLFFFFASVIAHFCILHSS